MLVFFGAVVPKTQTNQNWVSQRQTSLKELLLKATLCFQSGLLRDLMYLSFSFLEVCVQVRQAVMATTCSAKG